MVVIYNQGFLMIMNKNKKTNKQKNQIPGLKRARCQECREISNKYVIGENGPICEKCIRDKPFELP